MSRSAAVVLLLSVAGTSCSSSSHVSKLPQRAHPNDAGRAHGTIASGDDAGTAEQPVPLLSVGYDALRHWDRLPMIRIGQRAYMRSTYDRAGGNEGADASHFLRQERDDFNVTLDTVGPGVLSFVRTNHWHGSPWHYVVDGADHVVTETSTADPNNPVADSVFLPTAAFPEPLAYTWSVTRGADLSWVSVPFTRSLQLAYERTHYGTGYYIFQRFPERAPNLSAPIASFMPDAPPPADVLELLGRAGEDISPTTSSTQEVAREVDLPAHTSRLLADLDDGPRVVRAIVFRVAKEDALAFGRASLRITWDDAAAPQVEAPIALLFGAGTLYNRTDREYLVRGLLFHVRFTDDVELATYFPMPYGRHARIELVGAEQDVVRVQCRVKTEPWLEPPQTYGWFHATFTDVPTPEPGRDLVLLDTTQVEGGAHEYCGAFAGMSWTFSDRADLGTLEGDPRFFFDDSEMPQAQGTGTEEWGGGGDYWGGETMTLPLAGHPTGAPLLALAQSPEDAIESAYRVLISDAMPFGKNARIQLEHGGLDDSTEHYRAVSYWYGVPSPCLLQTDALHVGDASDERSHGYRSPTAKAETLTSRYELGVDHVGDREVYPAITDSGRSMTGTSELTLRLDANNHGVLLRRKLDYGYPDQRAEVSVADDRDGASFRTAGTWYLAGSNRSVYSNPSDELGAAAHDEQTSNRRFRDDEFLVPPDLTTGRSAVRIRVRFVPGAHPLIPGATASPTAWSEYRYTAYSYVLPSPP